MADEVKHTPLPWIAVEQAGKNPRIIGADGYAVAACRAKYQTPEHRAIARGNAVQIVEAVNNHAALRALLPELVGALGQLLAAPTGLGEDRISWLATIDGIAATAEFALAAARAQGFEP